MTSQRALNIFLTLAILMAGLPAMALAGRQKLNIDPETKEGFILQQIKQERNDAKKVELLVQFVDEFPKDENIPWVLEQLLPVYEEKKAWDKVLAAGERLLTADPSDYASAFICLRAAEAVGTPDVIQKYASMAWKTADVVTEAPKPKDASQVAAWQKDAEQARNLKMYAEYTVFALGKADKTKKEEYLQALEKINPRSVYLIAARQAEQKANMTIPAILEGLQKDPKNVDYLAILADHYMRSNESAKAQMYSGKLIEIFQGGQKPDSMTAKEWTEKKDRYLGNALWMNGMLSSILGSWHQADRSLRAALGFMRANPQYLSAGLYHLGFVNYKLAQAGEPNRVFEAIKFNEECAAIKGTFQEQAAKNIAAIKAEYSIR